MSSLEWEGRHILPVMNTREYTICVEYIRGEYTYIYIYCVCVHVRVCVHACVRACVCVCVCDTSIFSTGKINHHG